MNSGIFTSSTTTRAFYILADWIRQIFSSTGHTRGFAATDEDSSLSATIEAYLLHMRYIECDAADIRQAIVMAFPPTLNSLIPAL